MSVTQMDCIEGMRLLPDNCVDAIVTDPPYELGFMGKSWDSTGIANSVEMWTEALRVLKPGGHLLAFSGSRTYHRMTCAIEDAGFEVRDQIMWVYGSGFPKSLDVSKAIDKTLGAKREQLAPRSVIGHQRNIGNRRPYMDDPDHTTDSDIPATDAARQWDGWGTALKPAHEPICVARKPLIGTVAANVLAHGTGALNIDGCRVEGGDKPVPFGQPSQAEGWRLNGRETDWQPNDTGRWPANLIHDGSDEVVTLFPDAKGQMGTTAARSQGLIYGDVSAGAIGVLPRDDSGSAARFFYCAKTSKADRNEGLDAFATTAYAGSGAVAEGTRTTEPRANTHPTVKPNTLMRYLVRLVTPPGGVVLDPFTGSGSTGKACAQEGFGFIGFDLSAEYVAIANARIAAAS